MRARALQLLRGGPGLPLQEAALERPSPARLAEALDELFGKALATVPGPLAQRAAERLRKRVLED